MSRNLAVGQPGDILRGCGRSGLPPVHQGSATDVQPTDLDLLLGVAGQLWTDPTFPADILIEPNAAASVSGARAPDRHSSLSSLRGGVLYFETRPYALLRCGVRGIISAL